MGSAVGGRAARAPAGRVGRDHAARRRLPLEDRVRAAGRRRRARADRGRRDGHGVGSAAPLRDAHAAGDRARRLQRARLRARAARRGDLPALHAPLRDAGGGLRPPARRVPAAHDLLPALAGPVRVLLRRARAGLRQRRRACVVRRRGLRRAPAGARAARRRRGRRPRPPGRPRASTRSTASSTTRRARSSACARADALLRFYGRDRWGWPVGVAHHLFAPGADAAASERAWGDWVAGVFETERAA